LRKISGIESEDVEREPLANNDLTDYVDCSKAGVEEQVQERQIADTLELFQQEICLKQKERSMTNEKKNS